MSDPRFLFRTTGGVTILATVRDFKRNWHDYILGRGEAYTWEPYES